MVHVRAAAWRALGSSLRGIRIKNMKRLAWSSAFAIVIVGGIAATDSACTLVVNGDDGGNPINDSGSGQDTSTTGDTGTQADTGTQTDTGTRADTGTMMDGGDGGSCPILDHFTFGAVACDMCLGSNCCNETTACYTGAENPCADLVSCFVDCLKGSADAGIPPGTTSSCRTDCEGPDASASTFDGFVACVSNSCPAQCL